MKICIMLLLFITSFSARVYIEDIYTPIQSTPEDVKETKFLEWCLVKAKSKGLSPTQSFSLCLFGRLKGS